VWVDENIPEASQSMQAHDRSPSYQELTCPDVSESKRISYPSSIRVRNCLLEKILLSSMRCGAERPPLPKNGYGIRTTIYRLHRKTNPHGQFRDGSGLSGEEQDSLHTLSTGPRDVRLPHNLLHNPGF